ncbi:hypothetical protein [Halobellus ordinarius]|uniref:hypothetical protein n=1 Tax=Halobellus ordinarius TaxID=3075120 RepID=UPI003CE47AE7
MVVLQHRRQPQAVDPEFFEVIQAVCDPIEDAPPVGGGCCRASVTLGARLASGAVRLASGVARLASGVARLASGVARLASGVARLASGVARLASGAVRLGHLFVAEEAADVDLVQCHVGRPLRRIVRPPGNEGISSDFAVVGRRVCGLCDRPALPAIDDDLAGEIDRVGDAVGIADRDAVNADAVADGRDRDPKLPSVAADRALLDLVAVVDEEFHVQVLAGVLAPRVWQ